MDAAPGNRGGVIAFGRADASADSSLKERRHAGHAGTRQETAGHQARKTTILMKSCARTPSLLDPEGDLEAGLKTRAPGKRRLRRG
jgi:hypothetical protein